MQPSKVIEIIAKDLRDSPDIRALFLGGSYGNGMADAHSDLDFILVSPHGANEAISALWRSAVARVGRIVLWWQLPQHRGLINAITEDWTRIDVVILKSDQLDRLAQDSLLPLIDHDGLFRGLAETIAAKDPEPVQLRFQFEEFIRILGLLPLAAGREEYLNGVRGIFHLRGLLVDLLIAETAAPNRGGALHLNRLITDVQKDLLTALPPALPERQAMISTHLAYAAAYLPRARKLAQKLHIEWPEPFETATWAHLGRTLELERPYVAAPRGSAAPSKKPSKRRHTASDN